ncbi:MAG: NAD(P)/FAD-dependent oxidoreductase, partial [Thermomicrobiales bacterium]
HQGVGGDCGFVPHGLVVTVDTGPGNENNIDLLRRNVALQRQLGIDTQVVTRSDLEVLQPFGCFDDIAVAAFEPSSGYVDAIAATRAMAFAALREGARLFEGTAATRIEANDSQVTAVITAAGRIESPLVVIATGPWSTTLLASVGVRVPIKALRVQVAIVQRPQSLTQDHFAFVDTAAGMFCRPWGPGRSLIGVGGGEQHDEVDADRFERRNDVDYPDLAIRAAARRFPAMTGAAFLHGHAGLYDMTPDAHPIIGPCGPDGLYLAAGFCGAGFKKGPAVGQCLSEEILDGKSSTVDLSPFRLSRFDDDGWRQPWSNTEYILSSDFGHNL